MEQIEELQSRIEAALDRIGGGVTALEDKHASRPVPTLEELDMQKHAELLAEIADEKIANAQLEERLKLLHHRLSEMEETVTAVEGGADLIALQAELAEARDTAPAPEEVSALKAEVDRLKQELENAGNVAAAETEKLQDDLTEANAQIEQFKAQLDAAAEEGAASGASAMAEPAPSGVGAVDVGAVDAGAGAELDMRLSELDGELQSLRASNDQLREANAALRAANAEGIGDASLINAALEAEVEGLRAARATDQAEVNAVLARLEPLLATAPNLPEGEEA
ncbi:hypothetical protein [Phaeobacter sp. B1627]|uniref:hypothetical protein n=1 Tax=Phaeobacter sp. B1627 TaxID=2583809 RepID=UPI00111B277F|nr:hypothetical protein [Phaeobacter sp. B1627]TNJ46767.1 hypothetical protein FGE21_04900 [Phaeobacter sp. B1627]